MRYYITINQLAIIKNNFDLDLFEAVILDHLFYFATSGNASKIVDQDVVYYWFGYDKIVADLPILGLKRDAVYKRIKNLCDKGFLTANPNNQKIGRPYFAINNKINLLFYDRAVSSQGTDEDPEVVRINVSRGTDERPDNKSINDNTIKDKNKGSVKTDPALSENNEDDKNLFFTGAMEIYYNWFQMKNDATPKIDGADGKALKQIIAHFKQSAKKNEPEITDEKLLKNVLNGFSYLFKNWDCLDPFFKKQIRLTQINSNLNNIINEIKNGKITTKGAGKGFATNR